MKQPKQKAQPVKSARKIAKNELKERLLTTLKNVLEQDKIKLTKKIKKQSKKLIKAVTNELVIVKNAAVKAEKSVKAAVVPEPAKAVVKAKPAEPAKKAAPAKPAATKAAVPKATSAKASAAKPAAKTTPEKK